jgi:hypothetical protein
MIHVLFWIFVMPLILFLLAVLVMAVLAEIFRHL